MSNPISPSLAVEAILAKARESTTFTPVEIKVYQEDHQVYPALLAKMKVSEAGIKIDCLEKFSELGGAIHMSSTDGSLSRTPYIANLILIRGLVDFLGDSTAEVREEAARKLVEKVPDLYIRNYGNEVIDRVIEKPGIGGAIRLLAKVGSERALSTLRSNPAITGQSEFETSIALAKLGDVGREEDLIMKYKQEVDEREKGHLALALGFVASPKTILVLARDLRNPMTYEWNQRAKRSFRVHVIEGLGQAYPMERRFWRPNGAPRNDSYYQAIEEWATWRLGVTWENPRPPFLYEMEVPMAAPKR